MRGKTEMGVETRAWGAGRKRVGIGFSEGEEVGTDPCTTGMILQYIKYNTFIYVRGKLSNSAVTRKI